jgi:hypothetical protein
MSYRADCPDTEVIGNVHLQFSTVPTMEDSTFLAGCDIAA